MLGAVFTDDGTGIDPRMNCEYFWESVKDDWPTYLPAYVSNDEAKELAAHRRLWECGMNEDNPMTPRIEEHNLKLKERKADA